VGVPYLGEIIDYPFAFQLNFMISLAGHGFQYAPSFWSAVKNVLRARFLAEHQDGASKDQQRGAQ
jgi:hypothetical protein